MSDRLEEISQKHWSALRDMYLVDWPANIFGYYTISNYISWFEQLSTNDNFSIYSLNGDWSDGTFVDVDIVSVNTLAVSNERLITLLSLLDWRSVYLVNAVRRRHLPALLEALRLQNVTHAFNDETLLYFKSKEECADLSVCLPSGIAVGKLTAAQVEHANSVWPFKSATSLSFFQQLARLNLNVCLTTDTGKLVSWCFRFTGLLQGLQVDEEFRRKGFGEVTLKLMAAQLSKMGHDTLSCVEVDNVASRLLFEKNGFKVVDSNHYVKIHKNGAL